MAGTARKRAPDCWLRKPAKESLQNRILGAWPSLRAKTPKELIRSIRDKLVKAYNDGRLKTGFDKIQSEVKLDPADKHRLNESQAGAYAVLGGFKDQARDPASARLLREDSAWLHFSLTVQWDGNKNLTLLGYDFELVFPEGHTPSFIRFDLNLPGHPNEERDMRSHLHAGTDDTGLQIPAPVMTPEELLDLLVWGLRRRNPEKPRT